MKILQKENLELEHHWNTRMAKRTKKKNKKAKQYSSKFHLKMSVCSRPFTEI